MVLELEKQRCDSGASMKRSSQVRCGGLNTQNPSHDPQND